MGAHNVRRWLGIAGVPAQDNARAHAWERRLHWVMIGIALGSVVAVYLTEIAREPNLRSLGRSLEWLIFLAFSAELLWMLYLSSRKLPYLLANWLDVLIVFFAGLALAGTESEWVALARLLRLAAVGMLLARAAGSIRSVFTPGGLPYVFGLAMIAFLVAGAGFYWLEPTVQSFADGLWLAFTTGATVGYGDLVPTTTSARVFAVIITMLGLTFFSLVTASIAAFFIGEDEKLLRKEMHQDIRHLRTEVAELINEEERVLRREMHADIRQLRDELRRLREELNRQGLLEHDGKAKL
jgi:voltage-gated potassium channel